MKVPLVALINLTAELEKLKPLQRLTPRGTLAEGEGLAVLGSLGESTIFTFKFSGKTAWERHPDSEEPVQAVEGTAILGMVTDDGSPQSFEVSVRNDSDSAEGCMAPRASS